MRGLLFLALTVTGLIIFVQNRQPVTLFFLGTSQPSALASLTLPLGLWVVIFASVGIMTSLIINGLSLIGRPSNRRSPREPLRDTPNPSPQRPEPEPPPRSPSSSPRYQAPEPEPVVDQADQNEWDWDEPIPEIADWDIPPEPPSPKPKVNAPHSGSLRDRRPPRPAPSFRPEFSPPEPRPAVTPPESQFPAPDIDPVPEPEPQRREPLPDLRQFEAPQTPTTTQRQGTIYSQQYRPARSPVAKRPKSPEDPAAKPPSKTVYDAPYRVINPAVTPAVENPETLDNSEEDEDWI